jgi:hypothetical protein
MENNIKKELEKIEYKKRTWNFKFAREREIWLEIANNINGCKGKEQKYWLDVMDLYHKKYKNKN